LLNQNDEVFILENDELNSLPTRTMRAGLLGKTLEDALQAIFEKHPQLIPGKQIEPGSEDPPQFVLLRREMSVGSWSLDHLFVDQKGILTLVETKLIENPESRREVVGQIMEYAANAKKFWAEGRVRQKAAEYWSQKGKNGDLDQILKNEFGENLDIENFWATVETNLEDGKIRLIIATDELRPEVRRIIEYLNKEMKNAEILGLEIRFYGEESASLVVVPRIVGQTQDILDAKKPKKSNVLWTYDELKKAYLNMDDEELSQKFLRILEWAVDNQFFLAAIAINPSFGLQGNSKSRIVSFFHDGAIHGVFNEKYFFNGIKERDDLVNDLKAIKMLNSDFNPAEIISGRNLARKLHEISNKDIEKLLDVFAKYCSK